MKRNNKITWCLWIWRLKERDQYRRQSIHGVTKKCLRRWASQDLAWRIGSQSSLGFLGTCLSGAKRVKGVAKCAKKSGLIQVAGHQFVEDLVIHTIDCYFIVEKCLWFFRGPFKDLFRIFFYTFLIKSNCKVNSAIFFLIKKQMKIKFTKNDKTRVHRLIYQN